MCSPIIEMHRVSVVKGRSVILEDVDLTIDRGDSMVALGPNGAGKSTLIKVMMGEDRHDTSVPGSYVRIMGQEDWSLFSVRRAFGLVSGDLQVQFSRDMTALDAVMSGFFGSIGTNRSQDLVPEMRRVASSMLVLVGAASLVERTMDTLSTGESRRVLMARALVNKPEALILDEPMTSLDLTGRHIMRQAMRSITQSGRTIVLVTHDPSDIIPEIGRVVLVKGGRLVGDGERDLLNEQTLSSLYGMPIRLLRIEGQYIAWS